MEGGRGVSIEIKSVNKVFTRSDSRESFSAIENLNLIINAGEFVSFIGTSGCGKSTLLRDRKSVV